ncbi:Hypothetical_protein [Hexamita inflata]|uniref:Hypothetical_protein n=1 Tax=Hexamita inflata TaxID=28002 RepID=A0AA86R008_9EUKA|nr:Hypothetical protein HINF_LOCUS50783 [Hexamita inflata]
MQQFTSQLSKQTALAYMVIKCLVMYVPQLIVPLTGNLASIENVNVQYLNNLLQVKIVCVQIMLLCLGIRVRVHNTLHQLELAVFVMQFQTKQCLTGCVPVKHLGLQ